MGRKIPSLDFFGPGQVDPPPIGFVPIVIREGLQVGKIIKAAVAAAGLGEFANTYPVEDMIGGRSRVRTKERQDEDDDDNKHVVKVSDACKCVEDALNSDDFTAFVMQCFIKTLIEGNVGPPLQAILDKIVECIRSKELQQSNPKTRDVSLGYTRKVQA